MSTYKIYIAALLFLAACSSKKQSATAEKETKAADKVMMTDAQVTNAGIETGTATRQNISSMLKVNGLVEVPPQNIVSVSFPMGGYLRSTKLMPGMHVSRGEVIAVIEDQSLVQLQQDYLVTQARLVYLQQEYERQRLLNENKVNADKTYQQATSDYMAQKALLKGYSEKLQLIGINPARLTENSISRSVTVHSPINGFVSKVNVNIGKYVTATDVLFELINPDDMHAALTVFEKDITKVNIGQKVKVSFVDNANATYDCGVILVTRNVDENRSALVHCHFETKPVNLLPGMFLTATIHVNNADVLTVPEDAVVRFENKQYMYEVTGKNEFRMFEVETGVKENGRIEVSSKAAEFDKKNLVIKNAYAVLSKMKNTAEE
ncbi:MAG: efflux RND transporter periplasmic adaptor subunit [Sphingobacteriales bacterium]|nr:efflux RND transporter periplasmic adaptor subunit [Sphingobacteriales bacterium]